jgi:hypothetical protein
VRQELIEEIHRNAIWPVVVTVDGNISIHNKTDFIDIDGSYIMLIPGGNIKSLKAEIEGLVKGRDNKFKKFGILKLGSLWLEQIRSQCRHKRTYLIISQNLEYITALL